MERPLPGQSTVDSKGQGFRGTVQAPEATT